MTFENRPQPLRIEPRTPVKVSVPVSTGAWSGFSPLWTKDVSRGGAFFFFAARVVPTSGEKCLVKIAGLDVAAQVAHVVSAKLATATGSDAGFGVSFIERQTTDWWAVLLAPAEAPRAPVAAPVAVVEPHAPRTSEPTAKELEAAKNLHALGMTLFQERSYAAARLKFELAGRIVPDPRFFALPLVCNAMQLARPGMYDKAREALQRALQLCPECAEASKGLELIGNKR